VIDFKGAQFPKSVILHAVFFYVRYAVSYRDLEEIMAERGVRVDHATLNRWVVKYSPLIAAKAQDASARPPALGGSMKLTSRSKADGLTSIAQLTGTEILLILCCPSGVIWPPLDGSSSGR
jgi:hypothetical protein